MIQLGYGNRRLNIFLHESWGKKNKGSLIPLSTETVVLFDILEPRNVSKALYGEQS
ncbi:hypothetical protein MKW98_026555 [Papaver atlanticum]|uniref:Uncharacterized protein n=1 Tax=Papaver atlanticum TaxID=357466 RepID=A0AAD4T9R5_9MAGN|nr:hypothetical protein MKW98_026555 [Papaver atlanticum]